MSFHTQQKLPYLHLDRQHDMPSGQVHKLAITSDGNVWMATPAGLSHYDGVRVNTYTQKDGLGTHGLRTVYTYNNDELFIGTDAGLDQGLAIKSEFVQVIAPKHWPHGFIECVLKNPDGSFYLGTAKGLFHYRPGEGDRPTSIELVFNGFIKQLIPTKNNQLWISGKPFGVVKFDNLLQLKEPLFYLEIDDEVITIALDASDQESLLIGGSFGVQKVDSEGYTLSTLIDSIPETKVQSIHGFSDELWIGTNKGLYVINSLGEKSSYSPLDLKLALASIQVTDIKTDSIGNAWVSTHKNGVYKFSFMRQFCVEYECPDFESVFSIRQSKYNHSYAYLLASKSGLYTYSKIAGVKPFELISDFKEHIWDVHETISGQIWLATQAGLYLFSKTNGLKKIGTDHPVCQAPNRCLLEAQDLQVYLGTQNGLARITPDGDIHEISDASGQGIGYVYALEGSTNNNFYVGTIGNGAWYGNALGVKRIGSQYIGVRDNVYCISENDSGSLVILCNNRVILKPKNAESKVLFESEHAIAGWSAKWDKNDNIWIGTSSGLLQIDSNTGIIKRNFKSLPGGDLWEFNSSNSLMMGEQGEFFCGLRNNFTLLESKKLREITSKPKVNLCDYKWENAENYLLDSNHVKEGNWSLSFDFDTSWTLDETNLQLKYRLTGFNKEWSSVDKLSKLRFNSLPIGKYSLDVQAYSPLFGWGEISTIFSFQVSPNSQFGTLSRFLIVPIFKLTQTIKSTWQNLSLQDTEMKISELIKDKILEFEQDKNALIIENQELSKQSNIDALTGVGNRRAFDGYLESMIDQAVRHKLQLSLILLDVDNFKSYNDTYGHIRGDEALQEITRIIKSVMRKSGDFLARYGGEEFAIVLPISNANSASALAKRITEATKEANIEHRSQKQRDYLTCSMGIVSVNFAESAPMNARTLIKAADDNLYKAKNQGKNLHLVAEISADS